MSYVDRHKGRTNLNGCRVADESRGHFQAPRGYVANGGLHVARYPLDEVAAVFVLDIEHLLVHLLHRHPAAEYGGHRQVSTVSRVACGHHVLRVEHLLGELRYRERPVLLRTSKISFQKLLQKQQSKKGGKLYTRIIIR